MGSHLGTKNPVYSNIYPLFVVAFGEKKFIQTFYYLYESEHNEHNWNSNRHAELSFRAAYSTDVNRTAFKYEKKANHATIKMTHFHESFKQIKFYATKHFSLK